jgi:ubiquinone biosynthesis protein UbiJ
LDALHTTMRPLASLLNRQIHSRAAARALCAELAGKTIAIRLRDTALSAYLQVDSGGISLTGEYAGEPDVVIAGTLLSLLRLSRPTGEQLIRDGAIELVGDAHVAEQFQKLLLFARPDPEEELSRFVGDVAAHGLGEMARGVGAWGRDAAATLRQNVSEYLQEESRAVPSRYEANRFRTRVETLRDDVARAEARLRRLERQSTNDGGG